MRLYSRRFNRLFKKTSLKIVYSGSRRNDWRLTQTCLIFHSVPINNKHCLPMFLLFMFDKHDFHFIPAKMASRIDSTDAEFPERCCGETTALVGFGGITFLPAEDRTPHSVTHTGLHRPHHRRAPGLSLYRTHLSLFNLSSYHSGGPKTSDISGVVESLGMSLCVCVSVCSGTEVNEVS